MPTTLDSTSHDVLHPFIQRHRADVIGVLHGWDRLRLQGTLRSLYHPAVMEHYLRSAGVLFKQFKEFATGLTDRVRQAGAALAAEQKRPMIYLRSSGANKGAVALEVLRRPADDFGFSGGSKLRGTLSHLVCSRRAHDAKTGAAFAVGQMHSSLLLLDS